VAVIGHNTHQITKIRILINLVIDTKFAQRSAGFIDAAESNTG
jgi:hypothetical protein